MAEGIDQPAVPTTSGGGIDAARGRGHDAATDTAKDTATATAKGSGRGAGGGSGRVRRALARTGTPGPWSPRWCSSSACIIGYPLVRGVYLSLTDANEANIDRTIGVNHIPATYKFIGLDNYLAILGDSVFWDRLGWTVAVDGRSASPSPSASASAWPCCSTASCAAAPSTGSR